MESIIDTSENIIEEDIESAEINFSEGDCAGITQISFCQDWFKADSDLYNHNLCQLCSQFIMLGYDTEIEDPEKSTGYDCTKVAVKSALEAIGMKDIVINMQELIKGNDSLEIRSNLMWDASLVQTFLFNVGKPGDFQGHQIENCLGAYSHQTHGKQLAIILPAYYEGQYEYATKKFALLGKEVFNINEENELLAAKFTVEAIKQLVKDASLPTTFSELGYELTEEIARKVADTCGVPGNGPRTMSRDEIFELLMKLRQEKK